MGPIVPAIPEAFFHTPDWQESIKPEVVDDFAIFPSGEHADPSATAVLTCNVPAAELPDWTELPELSTYQRHAPSAALKNPEYDGLIIKVPALFPSLSLKLIPEYPFLSPCIVIAPYVLLAPEV